MKKWLVIMFVLALIAMSAVPALAKGGVAGNTAGRALPEETGNNLYALSGSITAIDPVARTVTVWVKTGNTLVKPYEGTEIVLQTTEFTAYEVSHSPAVISFENLRVGLQISSFGHLIDGIWYADRITVT